MMERKKASDFPPEVLELFDGYVHGRITRRDSSTVPRKYAVGGFTAAAMLESLRAQLRARRSRSRRTTRASRPSTSSIRRRRARARCAAISRARRAAGKLPGVVVIHENRGLNPYIEDVARRLAVAKASSRSRPMR